MLVHVYIYIIFSLSLSRICYGIDFECLWDVGPKRHRLFTPNKVLPIRWPCVPLGCLVWVAAVMMAAPAHLHQRTLPAQKDWGTARQDLCIGKRYGEMDRNGLTGFDLLPC